MNFMLAPPNYVLTVADRAAMLLGNRLKLFLSNIHNGAPCENLVKTGK